MPQRGLYLIKIRIHFSYKGVIVLHCSMCFIVNAEFIDEQRWGCKSSQQLNWLSRVRGCYSCWLSICSGSLRPGAWFLGSQQSPYKEGPLPQAFALRRVLSAVLQSVGLCGFGVSRPPSDSGRIPAHSTVFCMNHRRGRCYRDRNKAVTEESQLSGQFLGMVLFLIFATKNYPELKTQKRLKKEREKETKDHLHS